MFIHTQDTDFTLWNGDVLEVLRELEPASVHCVVTSPPYWALRDYGTGSWEGGDPHCEHQGTLRTAPAGSELQANNVGANEVRSGDCTLCGARRVDRQIGLEDTPDAFVARMVDVFAEVKRVLRPDGTLWLNLGDSYNSNTGRGFDTNQDGDRNGRKSSAALPRRLGGVKQKDLVGIPWRVALALQADGWYLRSDIIWSKPNSMPESVTDRPTKSHEYVFLLTKSPRYYYDAETTREPLVEAFTPGGKSRSVRPGIDVNGGGQGNGRIEWKAEGKNARSVWTIPLQPYDEAHFATYPQELVRRCILAGCPEGGVVLDPFMGSGTTALVARAHGRRAVGIELNPDYCGLIARRLQQLSLFALPSAEEDVIDDQAEQERDRERDDADMRDLHAECLPGAAGW